MGRKLSSAKNEKRSQHANAIFWGKTFLRVTGAEKSKKNKTSFDNRLTLLTHAHRRWSWHAKSMITQKRSNSVLLCSVSSHRWLCLRLLWLPRICDINRPMFSISMRNKTKTRDRGGERLVFPHYEFYLWSIAHNLTSKKTAPHDRLTLWMRMGLCCLRLLWKSRMRRHGFRRWPVTRSLIGWILADWNLHHCTSESSPKSLSEFYCIFLELCHKWLYSLYIVIIFIFFNLFCYCGELHCLRQTGLLSGCGRGRQTFLKLICEPMNGIYLLHLYCLYFAVCWAVFMKFRSMYFFFFFTRKFDKGLKTV